jgi:ABC-type antimicrobial peptide transport system permease subunit
VAISARLAKNLFGEEDPIGKVVRVSKRYDLQVKAVFADVTPQSTLKFDFILPFEIYKEQRADGFNWGNYDHPLYVKLNKAEDAASFIAQVNERENLRIRQIDPKANLDETNFYIQPLGDSYLYGNFENGVPAGGKIQYVKIFSVVAVFIVLIACINFMNMATARATMRAKEVGIRKVVGAQRNALMAQFVGESMLITLFAMALAMLVVYALLPVFNQVTAKEINLYLFDPQIIGAAALIIVVTGALAGSYPAFVLSAFQPASVLKGSIATGMSGANLRRGLVIFQFTLTVILIASALVVYQQIDFIQSKHLGYDRKLVVNFSLRGEAYDKFEAFRNEALQLAGVRSISRANASLVQVNNQNASVNWQGKPDNSNIFFRTVVVDYDFPETMNLELKDGRLFSRDFADSNNFVITERAVEVMGLPNPVGQRISQWGTEGTIVGVVKDFHSRSLSEAIDPIVLMCKPEWSGRAYVRLDSENPAVTMEQVAGLYKKYSPEYPFDYTFLDDDFDKLYKNERVMASLALGFTTMAVIISGLGLFGLAAFTTERKRKEIGIRKTLGASVAGLITNMSGQFLRLSLLSSIIGIPIAYWLMDRFLQSYAYHTQLSWVVFVGTALVIAMLSVLIVIFQVSKASMANPVHALRNE